MYSDYKIEKFGSKDIKSMFLMLKDNIKALELPENDYSFALNEFSTEENDPLILIIITPLITKT